MHLSLVGMLSDGPAAHLCKRGDVEAPRWMLQQLYVCIFLGIGVIIMASGLLLSKAINESERSCLKALTSHELCIKFCILPSISLTGSFRRLCNVLFSPHVKL